VADVLVLGNRLARQPGVGRRTLQEIKDSIAIQWPEFLTAGTAPDDLERANHILAPLAIAIAKEFARVRAEAMHQHPPQYPRAD
jgi:hypothetical protein